jgi:hypothetical protein
LSFSAHGDLIILAKLTKKLATSLILCVVGLAVLSNRLFILRQFMVRLDQSASFHLPIESTGPAQSNKTTFAVAIASEGVSELQQPPRNGIEIKTDPGDELRGSRIPFHIQTDLSSTPPPYILQSVLNL